MSSDTNDKTTVWVTSTVSKRLGELKTELTKPNKNAVIEHLIDLVGTQMSLREDRVQSAFQPLPKSTLHQFAVVCPVCETRLLEIEAHQDLLIPSEGLLSQARFACHGCATETDSSNPVYRYGSELVAVAATSQYTQDTAHEVLVDYWEQILTDPQTTTEQKQQILQLGKELSLATEWGWLPPIQVWTRLEEQKKIIAYAEYVLQQRFGEGISAGNPNGNCCELSDWHFHLASPEDASDDQAVEDTTAVKEFLDEWLSNATEMTVETESGSESNPVCLVRGF